ncbi:MAG TPA: pantetheine-phosphate adenylyltransferase [Candidatus Aenigmarchaeota archaeon]|nr:pantetheine-phosphate adenylyltransferase [Candidatus Aenigmarchaeota archaeon]
MNRGVYAGSFDPITKGHLWMIEQGARLFDELVVAVGINPDKKYTFSLKERLDMLKEVARDFPNVTTDSFENQFLVNYAESIDAEFILRGIRTEGDYEYERGMRHINSDLNPHIVTVFLMPPREIAEVSSSLVKGLVGPDGWEDVIEKYIPRNVYNRFLVKFRGLEKRWNLLWKKIGAKGSPGDVYEELVNLYAERAYHNLVHITHCLRELDDVMGFVDNPEQVETALWYHDAVYDTHRIDNEEKSVELAIKRLSKAGLNKEFIDGIAGLILATKHKEIPAENDSRYIVDIDLAILGKPEEEFERYERDIRHEYSWLPEEEFRLERYRVLRGFLERPAIYSTDFFREKYESQARKNIEKALKRLENDKY